MLGAWGWVGASEYALMLIAAGWRPGNDEKFMRYDRMSEESGVLYVQCKNVSAGAVLLPFHVLVSFGLYQPVL